MKKMMSMLIAVMMTAVLLAGCNNGEDTSSVPSTASTYSNPGEQTDPDLSSSMADSSDNTSSNTNGETSSDTISSDLDNLVSDIESALTPDDSSVASNAE